MKRALYSGVAAIAVAIVLAAAPARLNAQTAVTIDGDDIGGVVTSPHGPEAGVWVIAETHDLPTRYAKMVVTDDQGRYVVPDLPKGKYKVWVRGYGLIDSPKVDATPGQHLNLSAVPAPNDAAAAQYYPAIYWYSMLKIPDKDQFGGKSAIPDKITQEEWLTAMKNQGCVGCHQLGQLATRTIPAAFGHFESGEDAWARRIQSGQAATNMVNIAAGKYASVPLKYFGDWTDRIAAGELPSTKPERPQGVERNLVVTTWDWSTDKKYLHDLISSDKRNPTVNANGLLYGSPEYAGDNLPVLDPKTGKVSYITPPEDQSVPEALGPGHAADKKPMAASAYWGTEQVWDTRINNHNDMFDSQGRLWLTGTNHAPGTPAFCHKDSDNPYAKAYPIEKNERQLVMYDPKTQKFTFVDTCFGTHHLQFGFDKDNTLWTSGGGELAGWLDTKVLDETGNAEKAQGWAPFVIDTNGNGKVDDYTKPGQPADPTKDMQIGGSGTYAVMPNPADGRSGSRSTSLLAGAAYCGSILRPSSPRSTTSRCRASARAAAISTPRAWCGCRLAAVTLAASIAASARVRSTAPRRRAINARRAGHSTNIRVPALRASAITVRKRATTPGWTSTTRSGLARTCRSQRRI